MSEITPAPPAMPEAPPMPAAPAATSAPAAESPAAPSAPASWGADISQVVGGSLPNLFTSDPVEDARRDAEIARDLGKLRDTLPATQSRDTFFELLTGITQDLKHIEKMPGDQAMATFAQTMRQTEDKVREIPPEILYAGHTEGPYAHMYPLQPSVGSTEAPATPLSPAGKDELRLSLDGYAAEIAELTGEKPAAGSLVGQAAPENLGLAQARLELLNHELNNHYDVLTPAQQAELVDLRDRAAGELAAYERAVQAALAPASAGTVPNRDEWVGQHGGQCVVFVERATGHYFPVESAHQMLQDGKHPGYGRVTDAPRPGDIFVQSGPAPHGHTGIVESVNPDGSLNVIHSNYRRAERGPEKVGVDTFQPGQVTGFLRRNEAEPAVPYGKK